MQVALYSPYSYKAASSAEKAVACNGCGSKGFSGWIVPNTLWGLSIAECCNIHDWMYGEGQYLWDKDEADRVFLNNMLRVINANSNMALDWARRYRAMSYYSAVRDFGGPAFWDGK